MKGGIFTLLFIFLFLYSFANDEDKAHVAERAQQIPRIDGVLDDETWADLSEEIYFYEYRPNNGEKSRFKTQVKVVYTNNALYVAARLYDPNPKKIKRELSLRDDDDKNADVFGFSIDTYKNGQNAFTFLVTAAGVQVDYFISNDRYDYNWDAVWKSGVVIDDEGWSVEMEIPFYAIRFPKKPIQNWGLNFYRKVQREREESYWNYVDNSVRGLVNQFGVLTGIEDVEPPLRLSFLPYVTSVYNHDATTGNGKLSFTGGMDVKYGINESFTLDISLIPDFSQVRSDDQVLNLSPFEVRFSENRPFFTENIDIFSRNNLFYTRRVGQSNGYAFRLNDEERVESLPGNAPLINAMKVSGRTRGGTGLGIFNALTERTYAEIFIPDVEAGFYVDPETGQTLYNEFIKEERLFDPLTNYNVAVIDQNLKNNSSIGVINTNVTRFDGGRDANVTGADFRFNDKTNTFRVSGNGAISSISIPKDDGKTKNISGYSYNLAAGKVSGKWRYSASRSIESDDYNVNDLGFIRAANSYSHDANFSHNIFKPFGIFNSLSHYASVDYSQLYKPRKFTRMSMSAGGNATFANFWSTGYRYNLIPKGEHDYFESRTGQVFIQPWAHNYSLWLASDSRKPLFVRVSHWQWERPDWDQRDFSVEMFGRYRVNNNLSLSYEVSRMSSLQDIGYVSVSSRVRVEENLTDEAIIFGARDIMNTENFVGLNYTFNNRMGLNMRLRHLWSKVIYSDYYELQQDGNIKDVAYDGISSEAQHRHDINFNAFNVDVNFSWQVAPGSFFTVTWKNASLLQTRNTSLNFVENFETVINEPHNNSLSFRLTYFIDYLTLKNTI